MQLKFEKQNKSTYIYIYPNFRSKLIQLQRHEEKADTAQLLKGKGVHSSDSKRTCYTAQSCKKSIYILHNYILSTSEPRTVLQLSIR